MQSREAEKGERMADGFVRVFLPIPSLYLLAKRVFLYKERGE
jgi:hypothetical protein